MKSLFYIVLVVIFILIFGKSSNSTNVITTIDEGRYVVNVDELKNRVDKSFSTLVDDIKNFLSTTRNSNKGDSDE